MKGSVYLVGAGCGAYDLITLRGFEILKRCTAVVYDALIDDRLLDFVPKEAERCCVGKRAGQHSAQQEEINALLTGLADQGHTVVRLKGGDPFVFGRGGEEVLALQAQGIPYSLIPGISSCIAVPELSGIPVTHRMVSRGFHVITAHHADGAADFAQYAKLEGTLVFLMGLRQVSAISEGLRRGGLSGDTPAAVISDGATARQRAVRSTLARLAEDAADSTAPAIIVIGETAAFDLAPTLHGSLEGTSVTVTGTREFTGRVYDLLTSEGAYAERLTHVQIKQRDPIPPLSGWDCIVLTSRNGAALFAEHLRKQKIDLRSLAGRRFAVIGTGTAAVLEEIGLYPDIVPAVFTTQALGEALVTALPPPSRVLLLRAGNGAPELAQVLAENGFDCRDEKIYDIVPAPDVLPDRVESDYLVFGSASGVRFFFEKGVSLSPETKLVCIGTRTAEAAAYFTDRTILTAAPHTAGGVCQKIKEDHHAKIQKTQGDK